VDFVFLGEIWNYRRMGELEVLKSFSSLLDNLVKVVMQHAVIGKVVVNQVLGLVKES